MNLEKRDIKKHLFICCNQKSSGDFCHQKNPEQLIKNLKARLRQEDKWDEIKVTKSGCLGPCAKGISATLYPDNILITNIELKDEEKIYELLTKE